MIRITFVNIAQNMQNIQHQSKKDIPIYSVGILYQLETCKTTTELIDIYNKKKN